MARSPRVFLSHASEDKERFVLPFAAELRARGVDVWLDRWEMLPGDSLVRKIFSEGLDEAAAVIVVLSRVSITKPWVAEELDAAVVKRISNGSKLIPVVLDNLDHSIDIPTPIRHLLLEFVPDTSDMAVVLDRVVRSIFGQVDKPPLGDRPVYATAPVAPVDGLDRIDSLVLRAAGAEALRDDGDRFQTAEFLAAITGELGITEDQARESLEVLDASRCLVLDRRLGGHVPTFNLTRYGLRTYLRAYEPERARWEAAVIARLAVWPGDQGSERELVEACGDVPRIVIRMLLEDLDPRDLRIVKVFGSEGWRFMSISPRLRRRAAQ